MSRGERREVVAAVISVVGAFVGIAGAGHVYLREWGRAFAWFSLVLGMGLVLVGSFTDPSTATLSSLPLRVTGPLAVLFALNTVDAYYVAKRSGSTIGAGTTAESSTDERTVACPECGQEMDPELSFCPWCAGSREESVDERN